jgi:hypothetical protein
LVVLLGL